MEQVERTDKAPDSVNWVPVTAKNKNGHPLLVRFIRFSGFIHHLVVVSKSYQIVCCV